MKQPHLSLDLSSIFNYDKKIESISKAYFRVWAHKNTKDEFISLDRRTSFNHIIRWSIDCRHLNSEISYAFSLLEKQLAQGVTDTKKQGKVKWVALPDVIMQYYCNDIAYRIRSMWDKLSQIINVYFLNSKYERKDINFYKVINALKQSQHKDLGLLLRDIANSKTFKDVKSYRDDFTHNLTQELANRYNLSGKFWHTDDLIHLLIDSYRQIDETYEFVFRSVGKDAASTNVVDFQEMVDRTPFFNGEVAS